MDYQEISSILKALAHPTRVEIINILKDQEEQCVCTIYEALNLEQSNVSQHLKVLRDQKILSTRKIGQKVMYRIKTPAVINIITNAIQHLETRHTNVI